jgi:hypothetical protein
VRKSFFYVLLGHQPRLPIHNFPSFTISLTTPIVLSTAFPKLTFSSTALGFGFSAGIPGTIQYQ